HEAHDYRRRVDAHPSDLALRVQLGKRLLRAEDADGALGELQKATGDSRHEREARALLAQCFQKKGFLDLARKEYERALGDGRDLDLRAKEILYNLASIAVIEGDTAQARTLYARIYEVDVGFRDVAAQLDAMSFETSDSNAAPEHRPVRVAALQAGVFEEARTLVSELPGWSIVGVDEARGRIECRKRNGFLGGSSRITITLESPAGVP